MGSGMGSYGGYGAGGLGSYNRFGGGGMYGAGGGMDPYNNPTFSSQIQSQTMPAFAVLESLVTAFSSLAQLFESTYAATHSSFFAMVGVADQLGGLKTYLGQVLGLFSLVRLGKKLISWLKGESSGSGAIGGNGGWAEEWRIGQALDRNGGRAGPRPVPGDKKPSRKPLILFLLSAVGLPYLMTKLVRLLTELQKRRLENQPQLPGLNNGTMPYPPNGVANATASQSTTGAAQPLVFARTVWPFEATSPHELTLKRDEIVAILQRLDGKAEGGSAAAAWWRGRTRDGRVGWFPGNYVRDISSATRNSAPRRLKSRPRSRWNSCVERKSRNWIPLRRIPSRATLLLLRAQGVTRGCGARRSNVVYYHTLEAHISRVAFGTGMGQADASSLHCATFPLEDSCDGDRETRVGPFSSA